MTENTICHISSTSAETRANSSQEQRPQEDQSISKALGDTNSSTKMKRLDTEDEKDPSTSIHSATGGNEVSGFRKTNDRRSRIGIYLEEAARAESSDKQKVVLAQQDLGHEDSLKDDNLERGELKLDDTLEAEAGSARVGEAIDETISTKSAQNALKTAKERDNSTTINSQKNEATAQLPHTHTLQHRRFHKATKRPGHGTNSSK